MSCQSSMHEVDYYEVLGVSPQADRNEIRQAYRKVAQEYHPDAQAESESEEAAQKVFQELTIAYQTLSDPNQRKEYDDKRCLPLKAETFTHPNLRPWTPTMSRCPNSSTTASGSYAQEERPPSAAYGVFGSTASNSSLFTELKDEQPPHRPMSEVIRIQRRFGVFTPLLSWLGIR